MKILLLAVSFWVVSGCTSINIEHEYGRLPEIKMADIEKFCTKKARIKDVRGGFVFECRIKLK